MIDTESNGEVRNEFLTVRRFNEIQNELKEKDPDGWVYQTRVLGIFTLHDQVMIHKTVDIPDNVCIEGINIIIEKGADIRPGAYIRSNSWICENAVVGHCSEIKNSVLLPGAKAPHFNYVGDSILGPDVNLGAGCKVSNLRNDGKTVLLRLSLIHI